MAIAFDASGGSDLGSGTSLTYSHTCTGSDLILWVGVFIQKNPNPGITSVTYNGVAMTPTASSPTSHTSNTHVYLYYLVNPSTGANNVVITAAGTTDAIKSRSASYTGASQTGVPDSQSSTTNSSATTSITLTTITVADNCWCVGYHRNEAGNATDGADTTVRGSQNDNSIFDTNGVVSPAGSRSLIQNFSNAANSGLIASFAPSGGGSVATPTPQLLTLGVG